MDTCRPARLEDLLIGGGQFGISYIVDDRVVEHYRVLCDNTNSLAETYSISSGIIKLRSRGSPEYVNIAEVLAVNTYPTFRHVIKAI